MIDHARCETFFPISDLSQSQTFFQFQTFFHLRALPYLRAFQPAGAPLGKAQEKDPFTS